MFFFRVIISEFIEFPLLFIQNMPGRIGQRMRYLYWKSRLNKIGKNVIIGGNVKIKNPGYVSIGNNCWIDDNVSIIAGEVNHAILKRVGEYVLDPGFLIIGDGTHISLNVVIQSHGGVCIEGKTTIAAGAMVYSLSHHYRNPEDKNDSTPYIFSSMTTDSPQYLLVGSILIGEGSAVGLNAIVLPGSIIGRYSWLTVSSVMKGASPAGAILSGNPALVIKFRPGFKP